jgi:hypothetical protein
MPEMPAGRRGSGHQISAGVSRTSIPLSNRRCRACFQLLPEAVTEPTHPTCDPLHVPLLAASKEATP